MRRVLLIVVGAIFVWSGTAGAAQIVQPGTQPFTVPSDRNGNPVAFTIVATGFTPGSPVYVEQCDGKPPNTPQWSPTSNCDLGSSPPAAYADTSGRATFDKNDPNKKFVPFVGDSPQGIFACAPPGACTVRVSSNNSTSTADQVFFVIKLPAPHGPPVANTNTGNTAGGSPAAHTGDGAAPTAAAAGTGASAPAGASASGSAANNGPSSLAFTGLSALLAGIGLVLLGLGVAVLSRHAGRRAPTT